jgi:hypothetical protein
VTGVALTFAWAVYRLGLRGVDTIAAGLSPWEWTALVALTAAFLYGEGVRALGRRWVPWMVGRSRRLRGESTLFRVLAPLYAMSLVGREGGSVVRAWAGVTAIVFAVVVVSRFAEPWRGIVDLAVASALAWGLFAMARESRREPASSGSDARAED